MFFTAYARCRNEFVGCPSWEWHGLPSAKIHEHPWMRNKNIQFRSENSALKRHKTKQVPSNVLLCFTCLMMFALFWSVKFVRFTHFEQLLFRFTPGFFSPPGLRPSELLGSVPLRYLKAKGLWGRIKAEIASRITAIVGCFRSGAWLSFLTVRRFGGFGVGVKLILQMEFQRRKVTHVNTLVERTMVILLYQHQPQGHS